MDGNIPTNYSAETTNMEITGFNDENLFCELVKLSTLYWQLALSSLYTMKMLIPARFAQSYLKVFNVTFGM